MAASPYMSAALNFPVSRFEVADETMAASRNASAVINSARPIQNLSKNNNCIVLCCSTMQFF